MSKRLAWFVSAVMLFGVMGGIGLPASAAEKVHAVRRLFSTSEEITSICIQENNASVTIRPGEGGQTRVSYADTSEEKLYNISVKDGTLVVEKLKENPRETIIVNKTTHNTSQTAGFSRFSSEDKYRLEITVPQKQYESITVTNASNGCAELDSISANNISVQLKAGYAKLSQTKSNCLDAELDKGYITLDSISSPNISVQLTAGYAELSQTKSNRFDAEIDKGYITLDDTDSLQYDLKVETGKITGSVLGRKDDYSIEQSMEHGLSNLTSRAVSGSRVMKLDLGTGFVDIDFGG